MPCSLDKKPHKSRSNEGPGVSFVTPWLLYEVLPSHQDPHDMSQSMAPSIAPCRRGFCRSPVVRRNGETQNGYSSFIEWCYDCTMRNWHKKKHKNMTQWQATYDRYNTSSLAGILGIMASNRSKTNSTTNPLNQPGFLLGVREYALFHKSDNTVVIVSKFKTLC